MSASALRRQSAAPGEPSHVTSRDKGFPETGETPITPRDLEMSDYLDAARIRLGIQKKEIAWWWDCDHGYVTRVLSPMSPDKLTDERIAQLRTGDRADDRSVALYVAMLEEACAAAGLLTGKKAAAGKALEAMAVMLDCDPLGMVPMRMAKAML